MTFRKVPTKTEGLNTTRRAGDFLADNARPCLSDRCPTFADSKDYLTAYRDAGKPVLEEIVLPAFSFSTDFARAVLFVNECYNKYTSLIMNTEYPAFHPNGNRNGSFCRPRPIQKRNQKRKKQGNMTRRMPLGQSCTRRSVLKCSDSHCGRCESCHKHCDCDCGCMCMR